MHSDEALIARYMEVNSYVEQQEAELKAKLAKANTVMDGIRAELTKRLIERGAKNTKTSSGTAYLSDHLSVKVPDPGSLIGWALEHWDNGGGALVVIRPPVDAVRDYMAMHDGAEPPGCATSTHTRLNIRLNGS